MTPEEEVEAAEWIATRPPEIQAVIATHPPDRCYRGLNGGHYILIAYSEPEPPKYPGVTVRVAHGADSFLPGFEVFGVDPADLTACPERDWEWPTAEQREHSAKKADRMIALEKRVNRSLGH